MPRALEARHGAGHGDRHAEQSEPDRYNSNRQCLLLSAVRGKYECISERPARELGYEAELGQSGGYNYCRPR